GKARDHRVAIEVCVVHVEQAGFRGVRREGQAEEALLVATRSDTVGDVEERGLDDRTILDNPDRATLLHDKKAAGPVTRIDHRQRLGESIGDQLQANVERRRVLRRQRHGRKRREEDDRADQETEKEAPMRHMESFPGGVPLDSTSTISHRVHCVPTDRQAGSMIAPCSTRVWSTGSPFTRTSVNSIGSPIVSESIMSAPDCKWIWTCGSEEFPELPVKPTRSPAETVS